MKKNLLYAILVLLFIGAAGFVVMKYKSDESKKETANFALLERKGMQSQTEEWARTKKMGVNTLAFRGVHHGTFYAADGDCVGLTTKVPWEKNRQWMELVAKSGTPLFISAQPDAMGAEQKKSIKECFRLASQQLPVGEPLDWMDNPFPEKWKLNGNVETFDWN